MKLLTHNLLCSHVPGLRPGGGFPLRIEVRGRPPGYREGTGGMGWDHLPRQALPSLGRPSRHSRPAVPPVPFPPPPLPLRPPRFRFMSFPSPPFPLSSPPGAPPFLPLTPGNSSRDLK